MHNANPQSLKTRLLNTFAYHMVYSEAQKDQEDKPELNFFERMLFLICVLTVIVIASPICIALRFWAASLTAIFYWPIQQYSVINLFVFVVMAAMATTIQLMNEDK